MILSVVNAKRIAPTNGLPARNTKQPAQTGRVFSVEKSNQLGETMTKTATTYNNKVKAEAVFSLLSEQEAHSEEITKSEALELAVEFKNKKVRDGVLRLFVDLAYIPRIAFMKNVTEYALALGNASTDRESEPVGYLALISGALMFAHVGISQTSTMNVDVSKEMELVKGILEDATTMGCTDSLLGLLNQAIVHNVPGSVFLKSITALTFEKCIEETKE